MTIRELLEQLKDRDPELEVRAEDEDGEIQLAVVGAEVFAGYLVLSLADE